MPHHRKMFPARDIMSSQTLLELTSENMAQSSKPSTWTHHCCYLERSLCQARSQLSNLCVISVAKKKRSKWLLTFSKFDPITFGSQRNPSTFRPSFRKAFSSSGWRKNILQTLFGSLTHGASSTLRTSAGLRRMSTTTSRVHRFGISPRVNSVCLYSAR